MKHKVIKKIISILFLIIIGLYGFTMSICISNNNFIEATVCILFALVFGLIRAIILFY